MWTTRLVLARRSRGSFNFFHVNDRVTSPKIDVALLAMVEGYATKSRPLAQIQSANRSLTDASCIRQHCVEDGLQLTG